MRFENKTVIVTGGAAGIGKAIVKRFFTEGANVAFCDTNKELSRKVVAEFNSDRILYRNADITREDQVREFVQAAAGQFGRVDVLVNNARASILKSLDATVEDWELMLRVNIMGQALVSRYAVEEMKKVGRGSIINLGSISGVIAQWHQLTYNVTKAAMISMSKCLALDLKDFGIRVNTVSPGWVMTENVHDLLYNQWKMNDEQIKTKIGNQHLLGRIAESDEIAAVVAFLASEDASFITGANIMADGGFTVV
jgi:dihydroanticapsin dehydrogenase